MMQVTQAKRMEKKALPIAEIVANGEGLGAETVYCPKHGVVKAWHGTCEICFDIGLLIWDFQRLIPSWVGVETDGKLVKLVEVANAREAVEAVTKHKNDLGITLVRWDNVITLIENGRFTTYTVTPVAEPEVEELDDVEVGAVV